LGKLSVCLAPIKDVFTRQSGKLTVCPTFSEGDFILKALTRFILALSLILSLATTQSCSLFFKSEFAEVTVEELTALVDTLTDSQKRQLAQNKTMRDQLLGQFKTPFALAQAAEAEGLHKTAQFKQEMALNLDKLLASEYTRRNPDATVSKEDRDAYNNAHKNEFESDFNLITRNAKQAPSSEDKELLHDSWADLKIRAEKGRQAGIEKEPGIKFQIKLGKAKLLADAYSQKLEEQYKLTPEEKKRYVTEHPEADADKIKEKAQAALNRVKGGEAFEKVASEVNEDDTKTNGGELPWFGKDGKLDAGGQIDEDFVKAAFALDKGQFSQDLIKTKFGYHIVKLDDKRTVEPTPTPAPKPDAVPPATAQPTPAPETTGPQEQVHTRHIYFSTGASEGFEQEEVQKKVKRAMEDATLKYPVKVPADFTVKVGGLDPNRMPGVGGGQGGQMKRIDPNEKK
jgi:parvulin-like peptidyl-prolyl isomerase